MTRHAYFLFLIALMGCQLLGQEKGTNPVDKKVPVYRLVPTCPHGKSLWFKQQIGMHSVPKPSSYNGDVWNVMEMEYHWFPYVDDKRYYFEDLKCFKGDPNQKGATK